MTNLTLGEPPMPAAAALSDLELRALWQHHGGTIYAAHRETASMPTAKLLPFLRSVLRGESLVAPVEVPREPSEAEIAAWCAKNAPRRPEPDSDVPQTIAAASPSDSQYGRALLALVSAVCPGLDSGNLLEDAAHATRAMASAEPVGYFGIDDEPATDGGARYLQVASKHKNDPDVFPLFHHALKTEVAAAALPAQKRASGKGAAK